MPKHAVEAAKQGHDVVMSTNKSCYLNYRGLAIEKCYAFEPTPPELSSEKAKHILGLEPCLWGFPQHRHDELVFPRLCAFAEVGWSPKDARDWAGFKARLETARETSGRTWNQLPPRPGDLGGPLEMEQEGWYPYFDPAAATTRTLAIVTSRTYCGPEATVTASPVSRSERRC